MIDRRNLVGSGALAGAAALLGAAAQPVAAQRDAGGDDNAALVKAVRELKAAIERGQSVSPELERIREQQRSFLRANQKFPDFIEVGVDVWESVYDWHVRHQQAPTATFANGRYVMTVMFTTVIPARTRPEATSASASMRDEASRARRPFSA